MASSSPDFGAGISASGFLLFPLSSLCFFPELFLPKPPLSAHPTLASEKGAGEKEEGRGEGRGGEGLSLLPL